MIQQEPFGAILWHRRIEERIPLCEMAFCMGISMKALSEYELGWRIPPTNSLDIFCFAWMYGLSGANDFEHLKKSAVMGRETGPIDLSEYLGIDDLPLSPPHNIPIYRPRKEWSRGDKVESIQSYQQDTAQPYQPVLTTRFNDERPTIKFDASYVPEKLKNAAANRVLEQKAAREERGRITENTTKERKIKRIISPRDIEQKQLYSVRSPKEKDADRQLNRIYVDVTASKTGNVCELPREILWKDGKHFTIDTVLSAERNAVLRTGGVGIHYLCQIRGQQRHLCMEEDHRWFIESEKVM